MTTSITNVEILLARVEREQRRVWVYKVEEKHARAKQRRFYWGRNLFCAGREHDEDHSGISCFALFFQDYTQCFEKQSAFAFIPGVYMPYGY